MNASCTFGICPGVCLSECLLSPLARARVVGFAFVRSRRRCTSFEADCGRRAFGRKGAPPRSEQRAAGPSARTAERRQFRANRSSRSIFMWTRGGRGCGAFPLLENQGVTQNSARALPRWHAHTFGPLRKRSNPLRVPGRAPALDSWVSDQTRLPAEFKHINKRRKRN